AMHTGIGGVIGRSLRTAFPEEPQHWPETFDTVLRTGRPIRFEHTLVSQGRILELHSFRVGGPPRPRVAVVLSDVTARKRAEEQLRIADRLQAVGTLAGGVAHEINNQMTAVLGFGALVLKALGPSHPQASDQSLVLQAGKRAAKVSQQLLTYTRQQVTHRSVLDLQEVASDLRPVLQQLLGSDKQLVLELRDGGAKVRADRDQVEQVLINLVANARDATETGDTVSITIGDMTVAAPMPAALNDMIPIGEYVRLTVADSGAGMSAETLARSFDPFYTTKEVGRGTGLGLPMVYGTMRRHDGYVVARTALGSGTAVELYWPVTTRSDELPEPSDEAEGVDRLAIAGGGAVVLVADDEPAVCGLVVRVLEAEGYRVIGARDGASALATLEDVSARPDLVVTDIVMPALNGRQLADVLRTRWPDLPVLFMSGYTGVGDVVDRLVPSEAAYLQKPFTPGQLLHAVAQLRYGTPENRAAGQSPPIRDDIQQA
ncbi:MAG: response regulator, partial [Gemmatimonadales bacterium]|nr:response regulator [Gemmatimonadales bacterium]